MGPAALILAGPTASGKSSLALWLVQALKSRCPVEIISVDSALVYRGMDIGTAKPSLDEQRQVPHHLIDLMEPSGSYSAAQFVSDAHSLIEQIRQRGALPLLVGGTMLYIKALRDGLDAMPASDPIIRARLDARAAAESWPALHAELARVDPVTAARLQPRDAQRIQRALEVYVQTGLPLSSFHRQAATASHVNAEAKAETGAISLIALEPQSRAWLHTRIAQRFDAMLAAGFLDEVRALKSRPELHAQLPALRCVGYRQAWAALDTGDLGSVRELGAAATRQLAKRQLTWLRSMHDRQSLAADADDIQDQLLRAVLRHLEPAGNPSAHACP
jgi:tRNA dimethylallyltransferase